MLTGLLAIPKKHIGPSQNLQTKLWPSYTVAFLAMPQAHIPEYFHISGAI